MPKIQRHRNLTTQQAPRPSSPKTKPTTSTGATHHVDQNRISHRHHHHRGVDEGLAGRPNPGAVSLTRIHPNLPRLFLTIPGVSNACFRHEGHRQDHRSGGSPGGSGRRHGSGRECDVQALQPTGFQAPPALTSPCQRQFQVSLAPPCGAFLRLRGIVGEAGHPRTQGGQEVLVPGPIAHPGVAPESSCQVFRLGSTACGC